MIRSCLMVLLLGACAATGPAPNEATAPLPALTATGIDPPEGAGPGSCWVRDVSPAVIETVTDQVEVSPSVFRTDTVQVIVEERRELTFEVPCPVVLTPDFIRSMQRALIARGAFQGPVTGEMDAGTLLAIRRWQAARGVPSSVVSLETARMLGLVAVARE